MLVGRCDQIDFMLFILNNVPRLVVSSILKSISMTIPQLFKKIVPLPNLSSVDYLYHPYY
jgi:hypothetical protein